jgi:hypothetical protein
MVTPARKRRSLRLAVVLIPDPCKDPAEESRDARTAGYRPATTVARSAEPSPKMITGQASPHSIQTGDGVASHELERSYDA